jgi:hypothetical protein
MRVLATLRTDRGTFWLRDPACGENWITEELGSIQNSVRRNGIQLTHLRFLRKKGRAIWAERDTSGRVAG